MPDTSDIKIALNVDIKIALNVVLEALDAQINVVGRVAEEQGIIIHEVRDANGRFLLMDLLSTKANVLESLRKISENERCECIGETK